MLDAGSQRRVLEVPQKQLAMVGLGAVLLLGSVLARDPVGQLIGPSCGFRVHGTNATISVRGWSAATTCNALRSATVEGWQPAGSATSSCSAVVNGTRATADLRSLSSAARVRFCGFLNAASATGASPVPALATKLAVHVVDRGGHPIPAAAVSLREPVRNTATSADGQVVLLFDGGLGPGIFNVAATHVGYMADAAEINIPSWREQVSVTVRLSYLPPNGSFVRRPAPNVWDIMDIEESGASFTGHATEVSFDCAANLWTVLPVFLGRVPGKDAVRFKDVEVPVLGVGELPADWVPNGPQPDVHAPIPPGTC